MATNKTELADLLKKAGLSDQVEAILQYAKPCIRLHAHHSDIAMPRGTSRIGGFPDLPPNVKWLTRKDRPCDFIAQINLRDASPYDVTGLLPKEGLLLFFYDGMDYEDADYKPYQMGSETIVYYTGDMAALEPATSFPDRLESWQRFRPCSVTFETDWMLPNWPNPAAIELEHKILGRTKIYEPETALAKIYREVVRDLIPDNDHDKHHLLGYPEPIIQDDPLFEVPGVWNDRDVNEGIVKEWMWLLQISSDDEPGMLWGDTSSVYYCIRIDDLIARQFESAICVEQNY